MAFYKEIPMFFKEAASPLFVGEEPRLHGGVVKTAQEEMPLDAEIAEFSATIRPDAGSTWVLLNAMGQGEFYGPNVNGDFFGYGELVRHPKEWESTRIFDVEKRRELARKFDGGYTTFYNAHPFKHHANKNPDRAFGTVEVAHWNKRMRRVELIVKLVHDQCLKHGGMDIVNRLKDGEFPDVSMGTRVIYDVCFPPGAMVQTPEGPAPIESLREGDKVLSHKGILREVTRTFQHTVEEDIISIRVGGQYREIEATNLHPLLVLDRDAVKQPAGRRRRPEEIKEPPVWKPAQDVRVGDYLLSPMPEGVPDKLVDPMYAYVCGLFCGDGFRLRIRRGRKRDGEYRVVGVGFSCAKSEEGVLQRLLSCMSELSSKEPCIYEDGETALSVRYHDIDLATKILEDCGDSCATKHVPAYLWSSSTQARLAFLAGMVDSDGHQQDRGDVRISGVNEALLQGIRLLAVQCGIPASISTYRASSGYTTPGTPVFQTVIPASSVSLLSPYSAKVGEEETSKVRTSSKMFEWTSPDGVRYMASPIEAVQSKTYAGPVHNLSVAEEESYLVDGYAVHNCSICGNKAKNASEYCVHINERRREKDPKGDGTLPYMINIRPIFFDISFVLVGADRTARALWKIAQAQNAHLEDALYKIAYNKSAEIYKLSDLIKYVVPPMDGGRDSLQESDLPQNNRSEFPESILRGLGSLPMNEMFSTLGRSGAVLHPDEFKKIIIIRSGSPDMGSLMNLPMPSTSNIEVPADPSPCMPHGGMMQMLRSVLGGGMPNPMHTGKKIVRIIMGSPSLTATKGIAEGHPALQKISAAYNGYLLWSLADMRRMGGEW